MKLYEINAALEGLLEQVDSETGELTCDLEALSDLMLARDEKLEGLALYVKNVGAEAEAIKAEEKALAERRKVLENKAERAKKFLSEFLSGEKFQTPKVAVSWRKSEAVELGDSFMVWAREQDKFLRWKDPEPDKTAIKAAIKAGEVIPGAELVSRQSMTIK